MTPEQLARLTRLRHTLHAAPELSGAEHATARRIQSEMEALGADRVLTGLGGAGVAAVFDSGCAGPTLAIRCELDALPIPEENDLNYASQVAGRAHLCGHDGHMTIVVGVAMELARQRPANGRVVLMFQPAEETGEGAIAFRSSPGFAEISPDVVLSLHNLPGLPLGEVELPNGAANCASRRARIRLIGRTSHAAAPQDGVSPAAALADLIAELAQLGGGGAVRDETYALTAITHAVLGEQTFGVSPGMAELWVTLRTVTDARMTSLRQSLLERVRVKAEAYGLTQEITYHDVFEACTNAPDAVARITAACHAQGVTLRPSAQPQAFSEDFGQFAKSAPSAMFWLGAGEDHPQLHNPDYDFPDALIPIGTGIFLQAIRDGLG
ncbi:amidohydrolase [Tritonibacter horizontis]|uniref:N-acetyldiaminopimelate deacetylase n=1 Tax=Tritonibacter horizontis TaxID=1768241 RepID=A0A132BWW3_9RHOB|nr:amidohydrolase [Tritonibacter horizontis]KUP92542.1 N-acetyldiaminopimelate deacetylase [Tritonibacter horizontis]